MRDPKRLTRELIQDWLNRYHNGDRAWLAEKTGHSVGTVGHWFSRRGFPESALATIAALMEIDERTANEGNDDSQLLQFSASEFEEIELARAEVGHPPRPQFYRAAILNYVKEIQAIKRKRGNL